MEQIQDRRPVAVSSVRYGASAHILALMYLEYKRDRERFCPDQIEELGATMFDPLDAAAAAAEHALLIPYLFVDLLPSGSIPRAVDVIVALKNTCDEERRVVIVSANAGQEPPQPQQRMGPFVVPADSVLELAPQQWIPLRQCRRYWCEGVYASVIQVGQGAIEAGPLRDAIIGASHK